MLHSVSLMSSPTTFLLMPVLFFISYEIEFALPEPLFLTYLQAVSSPSQLSTTSYFLIFPLSSFLSFLCPFLTIYIHMVCLFTDLLFVSFFWNLSSKRDEILKLSTVSNSYFMLKSYLLYK